MAHLQELIDRILGDLKNKQGDRFSDKVYTDEPILQTASQMKTYLPEQYRQMRKMAKGTYIDDARVNSYFGVYHNSPFYPPAKQESPQLFYKQAKFMEDFEDDCPYEAAVTVRYPTYQMLDDRQLRGYFTWRTKVRQGIIEQTSNTYVYLYIYELLMLVGVSSAEEGYQKLCALRKTYAPYSKTIDAHLGRWIYDFVIYYGLDISYLEACEDVVHALSGMRRVTVVTRPHEYDDDTLYQMLCNRTSYTFERSCVFKTRPDDLKAVVCGVYRAMCAHHEKRCKITYPEKLYGESHEWIHLFFAEAVFHNTRYGEERTYEIGDVTTFRFTRHGTVCHRRLGDDRNGIGVLLKTIDAEMRRYYGLKPLLKQQPENTVLAKTIAKEIQKQEERAREASRPKIDIDLSKLQGIRTAAAQTRDKLIVEEEQDEPMTVSLPVVTPPPAVPSDSPLDEHGTWLVSCLVSGTPFADGLRERGVMLSVLVDRINETLFDEFGDTVIDFDGDTPVIIDDYLDDLKGLLHI